MQKQIIALFWSAAMRYPFRTFAALIGSILSAFIGSFVGPFIISRLLEQLQAGSLTLEAAWPLITLYAVAEIYGQLVGWRINLFFTWTMETAAQRDMYRQIFKALTDQSLAFHAVVDKYYCRNNYSIVYILAIRARFSHCSDYIY